MSEYCFLIGGLLLWKFLSRSCDRNLSESETKHKNENGQSINTVLSRSKWHVTVQGKTLFEGWPEVPEVDTGVTKLGHNDSLFI